MYKKLICATVLIAFLSVQLANTLNCYQCDSASGCMSPSIVTCNQTYANRTIQMLGQLTLNVTNTTSNNFECLQANATINNTNNIGMDIRGCVYQESSVCSVIGSANLTQFVQTNCTTCTGNLCNGRSPAANISASFLTLFISLIGIFIVKLIA